ncbi:hypothetical protein SpiGrapes_0196 [Sphaerochaeta pleomorpha str. Grapes]|uniref:Gamma-glutamylcyclotransferase AIG2-like domain-containing protein n=1 Tax=Sphaerochaeta pleomorpha (strain ATCC BAA-1885 / DSM 22778 / Grapes) TaxID=158190 RepID=G8QU90_SPHPG|nr:hypothetical protein SpiGrapes_0196 [Sphaerochaeta pleomorpha str. Grapes]
MQCTNLFVYGSLLEGFFNYEKTLVGKVITCVPAKVRGNLFHQSKKGYPALVAGEDWVYGELLALSHIEENLPLLDQVENYYGEGQANEYDRILKKVFVPSQNCYIEAYVYWYGLDDLGKENNPVIYLADGNWRSFMLTRQ